MKELFIKIKKYFAGISKNRTPDKIILPGLDINYINQMNKTLESLVTYNKDINNRDWEIENKIQEISNILMKTYSYIANPKGEFKNANIKL